MELNENMAHTVTTRIEKYLQPPFLFERRMTVFKILALAEITVSSRIYVHS